MMLLRKPVERMLSTLLGGEVKLEELNVSLMQGMIEAQGITLKSPASGSTVLEIRRIKAEISLSKALQKQIVIRSLVLERPVISIVQKEDGSLDLPPGPRRGQPNPQEDTAAEERKAAEDQQSVNSGWTLDLQKVLIVDGLVRFRSEMPAMAGYEIIAGKLLADLSRVERGFRLTLIVESIARRDRTGELGELRALGEFPEAQTLAELVQRPMSATLSLGPNVEAKVQSASLASRAFGLEFNGRVALAQWVAFVPAMAGALKAIAQASGSVTMSGSVEHDSAGWSIQRLELGVRDARV